MNRGMYGQAEGNENRSTSAVLEDRMLENEMIEGEWLNPMRAAAKKGNVQELGRLRNAMVKSYTNLGVPAAKAQERADSCLRQAMAGMRLR